MLNVRKFGQELKAAGLMEWVEEWASDGGVRVKAGAPPDKEAAVLALRDGHDPQIYLFGSEAVSTASDVDRVTAKRIRSLLSPDWAGDAQMSGQAMLRRVEELLAAVYVVEYQAGATQPEKDAARALLDANWQMRADQLQVLRQEGVDFKASRGW